VREGWPRADDVASARETLEPGVPRNLAERDDDLQVRQGGEFSVEVFRAGRDLVRERLVVRWRAADGGDDVRILQDESIVWMRRCADVGKARPVERGHEEIARAADAISREDSAGAIGTVRGRGQAKYQHTRTRIAKAGNWLPPIFLISIRRAFLDRHALAVRAQSCTALARDDRGGDERQRARLLT